MPITPPPSGPCYTVISINQPYTHLLIEQVRIEHSGITIPTVYVIGDNGGKALALIPFLPEREHGSVLIAFPKEDRPTRIIESHYDGLGVTHFVTLDNKQRIRDALCEMAREAIRSMSTTTA